MPAICQALWGNAMIHLFIYLLLSRCEHLRLNPWPQNVKDLWASVRNGDLDQFWHGCPLIMPWTSVHGTLTHTRSLSGRRDAVMEKANPCSKELTACVWCERDKQGALGCVYGREKERGLGSTEEAPRWELRVQRVRYSFQCNSQELHVQTVQANLGNVGMPLWILEKELIIGHFPPAGSCILFWKYTIITLLIKGCDFLFVCFITHYTELSEYLLNQNKSNSQVY